MSEVARESDEILIELWQKRKSPFFGERYDAPSHDDAIQVATPVGEICVLCHRRVEAGEQGWMQPSISEGGGVRIEPVHLGCQMGTTIGHTFGFCNCTGHDDLFERGKALMKHLDELKARQ